MTEDMIFRRPDNDADFKQPKREKDCMIYRVITGYPNTQVFAQFFPEYVRDLRRGDLNEAGKMHCRQFFTHPHNIAFMEAYEQTLRSAMKGTKSPRAVNDDIGETRKDKALKSLLDRAMSLVESGEELDPDSLKTITEIFRKTNLLKDEVERVEPCRRYLPVRCLSECQYRLFVESHIESGEIISECDYCKTRKFAEEQGWKFDATRNLELPIKNNTEDEKTEVCGQ